MPNVLQFKPKQTIYRVYQRSDGRKLLCIINISDTFSQAEFPQEYVNIVIAIGDQEYDERHVSVTSDSIWARISNKISTHISGTDLIYDRRFHSDSIEMQSIVTEQIIRLMT